MEQSEGEIGQQAQEEWIVWQAVKEWMVWQSQKEQIVVYKDPIKKVDLKSEDRGDLITKVNLIQLKLEKMKK